MTPKTVFSLGDSILLLILTALLSGLLTPLVFRVVGNRRMALKKNRDDRRARDQQSFEANWPVSRRRSSCRLRFLTT